MSLSDSVNMRKPATNAGRGRNGLWHALTAFAVGVFVSTATNPCLAFQDPSSQVASPPSVDTDDPANPDKQDKNAAAAAVQDSPAPELDPPDPWPEGFPGGPWWNDGLFCGPNALYVVLRLYDLPVSMEQVHQEIEIDPGRGCTPEQIKVAGEKLGLPMEARFVPADQLIRLRRPFILHGVQAEDREGAKGHFWVVVGYDEDYGAFAVIDGSSGIYSFIKSSQIEKLYSGWVVVPKEAASQAGLDFLRAAFIGSLALVVIVGGYLLLLDMQARRRSNASSQAAEGKLSA